MTDTTDLTDRVTRVEERQKHIMRSMDAERTRWTEDVAQINTKLDMLLKREYERQGAVALTRSLIAALGLIAGAIGGWIGHFWWGR